jgi:Isocitrate/isopropylmalate dehydrogenase
MKSLRLVLYFVPTLLLIWIKKERPSGVRQSSAESPPLIFFKASVNCQHWVACHHSSLPTTAAMKVHLAANRRCGLMLTVAWLVGTMAPRAVAFVPRYHRAASSSVPQTSSARARFLVDAPSPTTQLHAVASKKDSYRVALLSGDGIGPEITAATRVVLDELQKKCGFTIDFVPALIGGAAIDEANNPFPDESLETCRSSDSVLLACIGGYKWDSNPRELRPESGLLRMRKELGLFANLRPAKVLPQLIDASTLKREIVEGVDVMVVRELTGDVYFGTPKGIDVVDGT